MREQIINEIRRISAANEGKPLGRRTFESVTGIRQSEWQGVYWARWGDALREAGYAANEFQRRFDPSILLDHMARAVRHYGHVPTEPELRMYGCATPEFPGHTTFANHFGPKSVMLDNLRDWIAGHPDFADVKGILGPRASPTTATVKPSRESRAADGFVYLIRSGSYHKIGRSEELERRVKQIRVALPDAAVLEHSIRTDDPAGIEAYWHRRFADRRANGEWFKLTATDVAVFKRRTFRGGRVCLDGDRRFLSGIPAGCVLPRLAWHAGRA